MDFNMLLAIPKNSKKFYLILLFVSRLVSDIIFNDSQCSRATGGKKLIKYYYIRNTNIFLNVHMLNAPCIYIPKMFTHIVEGLCTYIYREEQRIQSDVSKGLLQIQENNCLALHG